MKFTVADLYEKKYTGRMTTRDAYDARIRAKKESAGRTDRRSRGNASI